MKKFFHKVYKAAVLALVARFVRSVHIYYKSGHVTKVILLACEVDQFIKEKVHLLQEREVLSNVIQITSVPLMGGGAHGVWFNKPDLTEVTHLDFEPRDGMILWQA